MKCFHRVSLNNCNPQVTEYLHRVSLNNHHLFLSWYIYDENALFWLYILALHNVIVLTSCVREAWNNYMFIKCIQIDNSMGSQSQCGMIKKVLCINFLDLFSCLYHNTTSMAYSHRNHTSAITYLHHQG